MLYEYRVYEAASRATLPTLLSVIEASVPAFTRNGMRVVGCWSTANTISDNNNQVIYMLEFHDLAHMQQCWDSYRSDPKVVEEFMRLTGGDWSFLGRVSNYTMEATPFSPVP